MQTWNAVTSSVFDVVLAPFGHGPAYFDLLLWPVLAGVMALLVYKRVSNQEGIERIKRMIAVRLYEIRLFRHDPLQVVTSTGRIMASNTRYLGLNFVPLVVLLVPMLIVLVQLVSNYAFAPAPVGTVDLLEVRLDPRSGVSPRQVELELPEGVALEAPPVRTAEGEIFWRLRADEAGDHELRLRVAGETLTKTWAVGGASRKVPVMRTKSWEALLYPGEAALERSSPVHTMALSYPERDLGLLPGGELGILATFFGLSLLSGFALKGRFGVTL
jgi:hypothetical protein